MFIQYNPNPEGKYVGDCVIRALAKILNKDWESVYIEVITQGYYDYDMPSSNAVWGNVLKHNGFHRHIIPDTCPECYTVIDFCIEHPYGEYILATGTHVIAVENGNYYDAWDSGNEVPIYYWHREA